MLANGYSRCQTASVFRFQWLVVSGLLLATIVSNTGATETAPSVTFAVIGHVYPGVEWPEILRAAVEQINELNVDAVFLLGDLVRTGTEADWSALLHLLGKLNAPWHAVPGNHDISTAEGLRNWTVNIGEQLHGAMEINGYQFLLVNSNAGSDSERRGPGIDESQRAFLIDNLGRSESYHGTFVMLHHILWLPESELTNRRYPPTRWHEQIAPLFRGVVDGVFAGDIESYFRTEDDTLDLYAVGWPLTGRLIDDRREPHEHIYLRKPFILLARCNEDSMQVEPVAVRCDIHSDLFDTARWESSAVNRWSVVGMKMLIRKHIEAVLLGASGAFFVVGAMAATMLRRRGMTKPEESAP